MNPYGITAPAAPIDRAELMRWNAANARARRDYYARTGPAHEPNPRDRSKERRP